RALASSSPSEGTASMANSPAPHTSLATPLIVLSFISAIAILYSLAIINLLALSVAHRPQPACHPLSES
ncbi:MAG TPA: hypothetical protein VIK82_03330, partial [Porticoccaceae bacterium]